MALVRHTITVVCDTTTEYDQTLVDVSEYTPSGGQPAVEVINETVAEKTIEIVFEPIEQIVGS